MLSATIYSSSSSSQENFSFLPVLITLQTFASIASHEWSEPVKNSNNVHLSPLLIHKGNFKSSMRWRMSSPLRYWDRLSRISCLLFINSSSVSIESRFNNFASSGLLSHPFLLEDKLSLTYLLKNILFRVHVSVSSLEISLSILDLIQIKLLLILKHWQYVYCWAKDQKQDISIYCLRD